MNEKATDLDIRWIMSILPHRYPFALVDKVIEFEAGKRAVGIKSVTKVRRTTTMTTK